MSQILKLETLIFDSEGIRAVGTYDEPWFVVKDVCKKLAVSNPTQIVENLPMKWKGMARIPTKTRGIQDCNIVNEAGLYSIIVRSNKPEAQKFREWVCENVIPSIRKKGKYELDEKLKKQDEVLATQTKELDKLNRLLKRKEKMKYKIRPSVYVVKNPDVDGKFKIGITKNMNGRVDQYNGATPNKNEVLFIKHVPDGAFRNAVENTVLAVLETYRCESDLKCSRKREWIEYDSESIINEINIVSDFILERVKLHQPDFSFPPIEEEPEEITTKTCSGCKEEKDLSEFYERDENKDKKENLCKDCFGERQKIAKEKSRKSVDSNPERKTCVICKEDLPVKFFGEHSTSLDGFRSACKVCLEKKVDKEEKTCTCCKETKLYTDFTKYRHSADGYSFYCRKCSTEKSKKYRETSKNKERKTEEVSEKECYRCKETKPATDFWSNKYMKDGRNYQCKVCCQITRQERRVSSS